MPTTYFNYGDGGRYVAPVLAILKREPGLTIPEISVRTGGRLVETYLRSEIIRPGVIMGTIIEGPRKQRRKTYLLADLELPEIKPEWYWIRSQHGWRVYTDQYHSGGSRITLTAVDGMFKAPSFPCFQDIGQDTAKATKCEVDVRADGFGSRVRHWVAFKGPDADSVVKATVDAGCATRARLDAIDKSYRNR